MERVVRLDNEELKHYRQWTFLARVAPQNVKLSLKFECKQVAHHRHGVVDLNIGEQVGPQSLLLDPLDLAEQVPNLKHHRKMSAFAIKSDEDLARTRKSGCLMFSLSKPKTGQLELETAGHNYHQLVKKPHAEQAKR